MSRSTFSARTSFCITQLCYDSVGYYGYVPTYLMQPRALERHGIQQARRTFLREKNIR